MVDIDTLNQDIREFVAQVTGLDVDKNILKADQDAETPKTPFATVKVILGTPVGHDSVEFEDQADPSIDLDETRSGTRLFTASINFFQAGAINNAIRMQGSAYESANLDFLRARGLGFQDSSDYRDLTEIDRARWEQRSQLDMFFYVVDENTNTVLSIQSQKIEGTVDDYDIDIEVTQ